MEPIQIVVQHYLETVRNVAVDFAVALWFSLLIDIKIPKLLTKRNLTICAIFSSALLLIAAIAGIGLWEIQTWQGDTRAENLNQTIFKTLSYIGGFLLFTYLISTAWKKKESQQSKP